MGTGLLLGSMGLDISVDTGKFNRDMQKVETRLHRASEKMIHSGHSISFALTAPIVAGMTIAIKKLASFEDAMRDVNTIARMTEIQLADTTKRIDGMSRKFGIAATQMAKGLYQVQSAGFRGADAIELLDIATKSSIAGIANTGDAARTVVSILHAYNLEVSDAIDIADILFMTVNRGILRFEDITTHLQSFIGQAALAKI